ncbi:MAG: choice-of-anchor Q domain-containing protein [Planctomycetota bacterium]|jgi:hypothetical protein
MSMTPRPLAACVLALAVLAAGCDDDPPPPPPGPAAPTFTTLPASITASEGDWVTFTVAATGDALEYEWQHSTDNGTTWYPLAWGAWDSYTIEGVTLADDGLLFRCVVSNAGGEVTSGAALLSVGLAAPRITRQPSDLTVVEGTQAVFSLVVDGSGVGYLWEYSADGVIWTSIPTTTGPSYARQFSVQDDGLLFRCIASNTGGSVTSDPAELTVRPLIFVDADATGGNDGTSWLDAYTDLQDALAAATAGYEIWVAAGTYVPGGARTDTFQLIAGVDIYGGFAGHETLLEQRIWTANPTILSGEIGAAGTADNSYHVVTGADGGVLDGFTITAGNANAGFPYDRGAGMYNGSASPAVTGCTFDSNSAVYGGGMCNSVDSSPTVTNCTFDLNSSTGHGGGMCNNGDSSPTVTGCTFSLNDALNGGGGMVNLNGSSPTVTDCTFDSNSAVCGGGMHSETNSHPILADCAFESNTATYGGGMCNWDTTAPTVTGCAFASNSADEGGGIYNSSASSPTVTGCAFESNFATDYGGGMRNSGSIATVTDCTFESNSAILYGGGVFNGSASHATFTNCAFESNSADNGGGMYNTSSDPTVTNCTFSLNDADVFGGGMSCNASIPTVTNCTFSLNVVVGSGGGMCNAGGSNLSVTNCIHWGNAAGASGDEIYNSASSPSVSYSCVEGGYAGTGNIGDLAAHDPLFVNAPDFVELTTAAGTTTTVIVAANGIYEVGDEIEVGLDGVPREVTAVDGDGVTVTLGNDPLGAASAAGTFVANWGPGATDLDVDLHLGAGSGCIDAADPATTLTEDIEGNPRPAGSGYDMGAYEFQ